MKKSLKTLLGLGFVAAMLSAMTVLAAAADPLPATGIYEVKATDSNCTLTAQNVGQKTATMGYYTVLEGKQEANKSVYTDAVRFSLKVTGANPDTTQVLVTLQDTAGAPTAGNIRYINQDAAAAGTVTFDLYPDKLEAGKTYTVQVATTGGALKEVGSFKCGKITGKPAYILGDADGDRAVTAIDATVILRSLAFKDEPIKQDQIQAADADIDGYITAIDATRILRSLAFKDEPLG